MSFFPEDKKVVRTIEDSEMVVIVKETRLKYFRGEIVNKVVGLMTFGEFKAKKEEYQNGSNEAESWSYFIKRYETIKDKELLFVNGNYYLR